MRNIALALLVMVAFSSCRMLRPSIMLRTPPNYVFDKPDDSLLTEDYRLSPNDIILMRLLSNEGFKLVDILDKENRVLEGIDITVESDGTAKMPLIGRIKLSGLTLREAEQMLETRFSEFYIGPFVTLKVINKRVAVFHGFSGTGKMIPILNDHTTVFEALALSGGITEDGKAYHIKLIRNVSPKPKVFLIDLSTIHGLRDGNIVLQANDIIYVEPRIRVGKRLSGEILPYVSILSSVFLIYSILRR